MPRISVIIPVYNMEKYLSRCLDSVIGQTFCDFEVICIDDGSKDKSLRVLQDYAKRDKRIVVISQPNGGVSVARNVGLNLAKAPTICFIDADDYVHPEMLACLHKIMEDKKVDVVSCLIAKVNEKFYTNYTNTCPPPQTQPTNTEKLKILEFSSPLDAFMRVHSVRTSCCAKLYKREILKGIYFEPNIRFEDIPFTLEVMNKAKSLALLKAPLYFYRQNPESFIHQPFTAEKAKDYFKVMRLVWEYCQKNCPQNLGNIRRYVLNRRFKMLTNQAIRRQKDKNIQRQIFDLIQNNVKELYANEILSYDGLKLKHKIRLFLLLHCRTAEPCRVWSNLI